MHRLTRMVWAGALVGMAGCASAPQVALMAPIGPAPQPTARVRSEGYLQVYSAREPAVTDLNAEEFFSNNDMGQNSFLFRPAHTSYDIYGQDGKLVEHVRNARDANDPNPALVALPPGTYEIRAKAEEYNSVTFTATVPVVVERGRTTVAHLDQEGWTPAGQYAQQDVVRLPNGQIVGWRASGLALAHQPTP